MVFVPELLTLIKSALLYIAAPFGAVLPVIVFSVIVNVPPPFCKVLVVNVLLVAFINASLSRAPPLFVAELPDIVLLVIVNVPPFRAVLSVSVLLATFVKASL